MYTLCYTGVPFFALVLSISVLNFASFCLIYSDPDHIKSSLSDIDKSFYLTNQLSFQCKL